MNTLRGTGTINLGGAVRPFHVGTNQTRIYCELHDLSLEQYNEQMGVDALQKGLKLGAAIDFLYSALASGAQNNGLPIDFDPTTVGQWMDEAEESPEQLQEIGKPVAMYIELIKERANRYLAQRGNAPAPMRVSKPAPAPKPKKAKK
ncbi:hypothetical protein [Hymenobacter sp. BT491]|uniref:hypothetical protein n=1 Tax=Hymenobacter sp. BT491 TaxID=2766779 RepID=UPI001653B152|nr:hypothetical protein [Hymenobacter sp. BT491]MBC6988933.1 hypothetical protein [Hymenobacter sp. BT491]